MVGTFSGIMLTSVCRKRRIPEDLDKPLQTRVNCHIRRKSANGDMLTSILNSWASGANARLVGVIHGRE